MKIYKCVQVLLILFFVIHQNLAQPQQYETIEDIQYYSDEPNNRDEYINSRCKLDLYYPKGIDDFNTIVWFHGGGLRAGEKHFPAYLMDKDVAIVAVNYRLYPKIGAPVYIEDAAAAVAWTFKNIESYGGSVQDIFVSGHSAGGYLASMVGLDKKWLASHSIDADQIKGLIPFSGHAITHFTVRKEMNLEGTKIIADELAPINHVRNDAPPYLIITGDRDLELLGRYEENAFMWRMMQIVGHKDCNIIEIEGYNHGEMAQPAYPLLLKEVKRLSSKQKVE